MTPQPSARFALVRRIAQGRGWSARRTFQACLLAGFGLALSGFYLRRTGVPDEEALGPVLVPPFALAAHRELATRRPAWLGVATDRGLGRVNPVGCLGRRRRRARPRVSHARLRGLVLEPAIRPAVDAPPSVATASPLASAVGLFAWVVVCVAGAALAVWPNTAAADT